MKKFLRWVAHPLQSRPFVGSKLVDALGSWLDRTGVPGKARSAFQKAKNWFSEAAAPPKPSPYSMSDSSILEFLRPESSPKRHVRWFGDLRNFIVRDYLGLAPNYSDLVFLGRKASVPFYKSVGRGLYNLLTTPVWWPVVNFLATKPGKGFEIFRDISRSGTVRRYVDLARAASLWSILSDYYLFSDLMSGSPIHIGLENTDAPEGISLWDDLKSGRLGSFSRRLYNLARLHVYLTRYRIADKLGLMPSDRKERDLVADIMLKYMDEQRRYASAASLGAKYERPLSSGLLHGFSPSLYHLYGLIASRNQESPSLLAHELKSGNLARRVALTNLYPSDWTNSEMLRKDFFVGSGSVVEPNVWDLLTKYPSAPVPRAFLRSRPVVEQGVEPFDLPNSEAAKRYWGTLHKIDRASLLRDKLTAAELLFSRMRKENKNLVPPFRYPDDLNHPVPNWSLVNTMMDNLRENIWKPINLYEDSQQDVEDELKSLSTLLSLLHVMEPEFELSDRKAVSSLIDAVTRRPIRTRSGVRQPGIDNLIKYWIPKILSDYAREERKG